jgi:hypothetical protein
MISAPTQRRPNAEVPPGDYARADFDWYQEEVWVTEALIRAEADFGSWGAVWDPACGGGNVLEAFRLAGKVTQSSDIRFRGYAARGVFCHMDFTAPDFGTVRTFSPMVEYSVVSNPPYSYTKGIAEAFARRALALATNKVALLLPGKWQASEARHAFFQDFPPARIWVLSERPSMPPGEQVAALGDKAFKRGRIDFNWLVWDMRHPTAPGETRWATLPPRLKTERKKP